MDFWESLSGEYVTVRQPTVLDVPNEYGDVWVVGNWPVTGQNNRGGLTITATGECIYTCMIKMTDSEQMVIQRPSLSRHPSMDLITRRL